MNFKSKASFASLTFALLFLASGAMVANAQQKPKPPTAAVAGGDAKQAELDKKFKELLTGSKFVGRYTVSEDINETPKSDEYHIQSVTKLEGDKWQFVARIKFGNVDASLPFVLDVKWAGETPVITLDKMDFPGIGTYSARVVIHGKKYAASWDGGDHGGFMWGTIERGDANAEDKAK